jgi:hypothetical protein
MAQVVRCDVCGKLFSSSHVASHKRLAHRDEEKAILKILSLFKNLSSESKKRVLESLESSSGREQVQGPFRYSFRAHN